VISARLRTYVFPAAILLISLAGGMLIFYSTTWGPWAFSDSAAYLATSRNLIAGRGFGYFNPDGSWLPFTYYPPLYPLFLAIPGLLGTNLVIGARLLDMILFASLILILGWGTYRYTRLAWMGCMVGALILGSPILVDAYSSLMSEPLFITIGFSGLVALLFYLRENKRSILVIAALVSGLAMLTRYIGFAYLVTAILAILLLSGTRIKKRLVDVLFFSLIATLPTLASQVWVYLVSAHLAGRSFGLDNSFLTSVRDFGNQLAGVLNSWLPWSTRGVSIFPPPARLLVITMIGLLALVFVWLRLRDQPEYNGLLRFNNLMFFFCVLYPTSLGLSYIYSSPPVAINSRMLSPLLPALLALACGLLAGIVKSFRSRWWVKLICLGLFAAVIVMSAPKAWRLAVVYHQAGAGYTAKTWHDPLTFTPLQQIPSGVKVISNDPALMLFYLNRFPYDLAQDIDWAPSTSEPVYGDGSEKMQALFKAGAAMVIFLPQWEALFGSQAQLRYTQLTTGLYKAYSSPEFDVYYFSAKSQVPSCGCDASQEFPP
jgi:4-amino-4-deoxy-L-arabinose transferase-like glycosyltransferase